MIDGNKKIDILEDKLNIESNNIKETIVNQKTEFHYFLEKSTEKVINNFQKFY